MNYFNEDIVVREKFKLVNYLPKIGIERIQQEILTGLRATPKSISSKYFYNELGSKLFEQITQLSEYYPTHTEKSIISTLYPHLNIDFSNLNIIELGSGDHSKIDLLLQQIPGFLLDNITYYPVDISKSAIEKSSLFLQQNYPGLKICGIVADFIHQLKTLFFKGKNLFCFLGSTIGNLNPQEVKTFMEDLSSIMKPGDHLLMGIDLVKDEEILENAYNDSKETTAAFNKNILTVVNGILGCKFNLDDFVHHAFYNNVHHRIEMHLVASKLMKIEIPNQSKPIQLCMGESILTEYSHKFHPDAIAKIGNKVNLTIDDLYMDSKEWFSLVHFIKS